MPNFDAGHYFLTVLAPLRSDPVAVAGQRLSRRHLVKEVLGRMPTGQRTMASHGKGWDNPFARTTCTHFARFFVVDDVVFNGRVSGDTLVARVLRLNPVIPQRVDSLASPFLAFVADFDAPGGDDALRSYTDTLWGSMQAELVEIFQHCVGFDASGESDGFFAYIKACQIETVMPFNDYWSAPPVFPSFDLKPYMALAILGGVLLLVGVLAWQGWIVLLGLLVLGIDVFLGVREISAAGRVPFPVSPAPAPGADLPTVLKALHVQRAFTRFAIEAQALRAGGGGDTALHEAFGAFLAAERPGDTDGPTQAPGIIGA
jgi:hypothetical protein